MIAGIDGGGTSTKVELRDADNRLIQRMAFGPFNISAVGEAGVRSVLRELCEAVYVRAIDRLCVGGAGVSFAGLRELLLDELGAHGFAGGLTLCSDFESALRGAMDGPGGILIAGTGSVAFGRNAAGDTARVGGWGHLIDDVGSGYALGRDALAAAVQTGDGRLQAHALRAAVLHQIGGQGTPDILNYVYYSGRDKSAVAALASCVLSGAAEGDDACREILSRGAVELTRIVRALAQQLSMERPRVALLGGLLQNDTPYAQIARQQLAAVCEPVAPAHDALWGAAQLAYEGKA